MGGADQWGNITTGSELIRRMSGEECYALTCPLITKADGKKFGKTEKGNIWLDRNRTSPYQFYQFWLNVADEDAERYIKIFTSLTREEIDAIIAEHRQDPGQRVLQKRLAREVTIMVHSEADYDMALEASQILFGKSTKEALLRLDEQTLLDVFDGVPHYEVYKALFEGEGTPAIVLTTDHAAIFPSKGEMRKLTQGGGVSINKEKLADPNAALTTADLLDGKYLLVQQGKKKYFLVIAK
jgi:tyrosyl-tRNA synthetase